MMRTAYDYLVLDAETRNAPEEWAEEWFNTTWRAPGNYTDPKKIAAKRKEAWEKTLDKLALLPCSPMTAIGLKSETELRCLHCMWEHAPKVREVNGWPGMVEGFSDERKMFETLSVLLAAKADAETLLAGFNCRYFDFPALRRALARLKMPIPEVLLNPEQPMFDNMEKWCRLFAGSREMFANCPEVSVGLGIEPHKVSGAVVPELFANGEFELVVDKVLLDVLEEEQQFLRMTGRSGK